MKKTPANKRHPVIKQPNPVQTRPLGNDASGPGLGPQVSRPLAPTPEQLTALLASMPPGSQPRQAVERYWEIYRESEFQRQVAELASQPKPVRHGFSEGLKMIFPTLATRGLDERKSAFRKLLEHWLKLPGLMGTAGKKAVTPTLLNEIIQHHETNGLSEYAIAEAIKVEAMRKAEVHKVRARKGGKAKADKKNKR